MLDFNCGLLSPAERYKLLSGLVVPRPIALITTVSAGGIVNAAPFSFFNVFSEDPAIVVVGLAANVDAERSLKDTTRNIRASGFFVINMVDEDLCEAMAKCSLAFPSDVSEPKALGLTLSDGLYVPVPHLESAPVALECRKMTMMNYGNARDLLVGEVLGIRVRDGIIDAATLKADYNKYLPVGRIGGEVYSRISERFEVKPGTYQAWAQSNG